MDIPAPLYDFSDPKLWTDWTWSQRFPGSVELRSYFQYVAEKWDLRKDSIFNTLVTSAVWHEDTSTWVVRTKGGDKFETRFFLPNTGFAAKRHIPEWKGIETFEGTWLHPSYWPKKGLDLRGKKIAVIGTGSSGVQLCQNLAPLASDFVLFQRTPNLALPMRQEQYEGAKNESMTKEEYAKLYAGRKESYGGLDFNFAPKSTFDDSEEQRKQFYEELWQHGDFHFWLATYQDMLFNDSSNTEAYNFW